MLILVDYKLDFIYELNDMNRTTLLKGCATITGASLATFLLYTQFLQIFSPLAIRFWVAISGTFLLLLLLIGWLVQRASQCFDRQKSKLTLIIPIALFLSLVVILALPAAPKGLLKTHILFIDQVNESGSQQFLGISLFKHEFGEVSFESLQKNGRWTRTSEGLLTDSPGATLKWKGKPGKTATLEFLAGPQGDLVTIIWDGISKDVSLYQKESQKISYEFTFPPVDDLPVFIALYLLLVEIGFLLILLTLEQATNNRPNLFLWALWLGFVVFRVLQFAQSSEVLTMVDSGSYTEQANFSFFQIMAGHPVCYTADFCIGRPFLVPLLYKILSLDPTLISLTQLGLSIVCWSFLAFSSIRIVSGFWLKLFSMTVLLGLGSVPNVTRWDRVLLSESLTISISALLIASWIWMTRNSHWRKSDTILLIFSSFFS